MIFRVCILFLSFGVLLFSASPKELFKKIEESKSSIAVSNKEKSALSKQLKRTAKKITKLEKEVAALDEKLKKINSSLKKEEAKYQEAQREIRSINTMLKELDKDITARKKEFAKKLSKQLGSVIAQNKIKQKSEKSVVLEEVYSHYKNYNQAELLKLTRNIEQKSALRENLKKRRDAIEKSIKNVKAQKDVYKKESKIKRQLLAKLAKEEKKYSKRLKAIFRKQTILRLTLTKLNLIQEDAAKAAKKRELELKKRIRRLAKLNLSKKGKGGSRAVRESHTLDDSSYITSNIAKYRGVKTIAPLKDPKVLKSFGRFKDPIYHMQSFSDSVTLASKSGDKRIFNVLNGEVIYIGPNNMLGKMIVVKHNNGLHTIYADIDKFSPFIKKGSMVKKGTVLGKVKRKLIFEATKSGKFINPLRLINL
jgi:septal ring factor EnvC (AmiA/AmiB activator)